MHQRWSEHSGAARKRAVSLWLGCSLAGSSEHGALRNGAAFGSSACTASRGEQGHEMVELHTYGMAMIVHNGMSSLQPGSQQRA